MMEIQKQRKSCVLFIWDSGQLGKQDKERKRMLALAYAHDNDMELTETHISKKPLLQIEDDLAYFIFGNPDCEHDVIVELAGEITGDFVSPLGSLTNIVTFEHTKIRAHLLENNHCGMNDREILLYVVDAMLVAQVASDIKDAGDVVQYHWQLINGYYHNRGRRLAYDAMNQRRQSEK